MNRILPGITGPIIPPPVAAGLCAALMYGAERLAPALTFDFAAREPLSIAIAVFGAFFSFFGIAKIMLSGTTVNPLTPQRAARLVTKGVYALSRNPIYVGDALFLAAYAVWLSNPLALPAIPLFIAWIDRFQIRREEEALNRIFGAEFDDYKKRVHRWL